MQKYKNYLVYKVSCTTTVPVIEGTLIVLCSDPHRNYCGGSERGTDYVGFKTSASNMSLFILGITNMVFSAP